MKKFGNYEFAKKQIQYGILDRRFIRNNNSLISGGFDNLWP